MKKLFVTLFAAALMASCSSGPREESADQDSINAAASADSLLQNELNADTSSNSDTTATDHSNTTGRPDSTGD
jgi:hypothetical protein